MMTTTKIINLMFYLVIFTISFDVFLVINIGFNFRAAQLCLIIPMIFYILNIFLKGTITVPLGITSLLIWTLFVIIFIPNTPLMSRNIGYGIWLIFNILIILVTVHFFGDENKMKKLIKVYLYSFPFISICGLIQFFMPILHFKPFLVLQWWIPDVLPRINAFSYEPSYFATYMILGWVLTAYLLQTKSSLVKMSHLTVIFLLETTVMILSSSRMGWIMMVFWFSQFPLLFLWRIINTKVNKKYLNYTLWLCLLSVITIFTVVYVVGVNKVLFLMNGIGIGNTSSHSVDIRSKELADTIKIFLESPIWGYSLGGIAWAIGNLRGIDVNNLELAKSNEGMSVFGEVLAASGIIGFIPFAIYIGSLIILPLKLAIRISNTEMKIILRGMVYSLIFILVILQFNQNILRPYLWLHIAILSAVYFAAKREVSYVNTNN